MMFFHKSQMHPISNVSRFKSYIYKNNIFNIFIIFVFFYFLMSLLFSIGYYLSVDNVPFKNIFKFALLSSFGFNTENELSHTDLYFVYNLLHQMASLFMSTIFTAAIVLKYFYLPTFFVFKKKCNLVKDENSSELVISLYNSSDLFVTNCHIRVYGREESIDAQGTKSLININNKEPIFDYTYPFMDQHLATRLRIKYQEQNYQSLIDWFDGESVKNKKLDLILLVEANVSKLDSPIYEVYKYTIDSNNMTQSIDFREPVSIDLNYDNFSQSEGWDKFED